jgi:DNA recombination protein RmuC
MWPTLFTLAAVACVLLLLAAVRLWTQRQALRTDRDRIASDLAQRETAIEGYLDEVQRLRDLVNKKENQLTEQRAKHEGIDDKFKALANDVLKQSNEQFLQLAKKTFDGEQKDAAAQLEQRKQAIESLIKPIRESLDKHSKVVADVEKDRKQDQGSLRQHLSSMIEVQRRLGDQTTALTTALKGSATARGRWGEITLRRVVEMAGMSAYCDFDEQVTIWNGEASLRPDMVVNLPSSRSIVIDAKAVGENYFQAMESTDPTQRKQFLTKHAADLRSRVTELSRKSYAQSLSQAPDFVVLFVPGEAFLTAALDAESSLAESAMSNGVVIATPAILISLLRVVEMGWRETRMAENARKISDLGKELHERIAVATGHIDKLGSNLGRAVKAYNDFVGSFETRIVSSARKFKDLGADSPKELPADPAPQIEIIPREVKQPASTD